MVIDTGADFNWTESDFNLFQTETGVYMVIDTGADFNRT